MLKIKDLNKTYSSGFALNDISIALDKGDFMLLFGPDDAGKTALLYQILGLHHFREGDILFDGKPIQSLNAEERKQIRFVPDSICEENITAKEYFETLSKLYPEYQADDVDDMCEYFSVDLDSFLMEMTYNENKLAMIIGAMITNPKLLILDEPFNFMTMESGKKLLEFLKYLSSKGVTILITSEESSWVWEYCNKYVYLQNGSVLSVGEVADYLGEQKAITVAAKESGLAESILGAPIARNNTKATFIYDKKKLSKSLADILGFLKVSDIEIENLTLEEMLDEDYTRWM